MKTEEKYISFEPWRGGYSNVKMSYEMAIAIAHITNRTLILPPKIYCLFITEPFNKNTFFDIWETLDKEAIKKEVKCIDFEDVPEYKNLISDEQYFEKVNRVAKIILFDENEKYFTEDCGNKDHFKCQKTPESCNVVLVDNIVDYKDFDAFSKGRRIVYLNSDDKFIHFPKNLFGHFYYFVYGNSIYERNRIKEKVKNGLKYKNKFFDIAKKIRRTIGYSGENACGYSYNAVHIRRNDFLRVNFGSAKSQMETLFQDLEKKIKNNLPLYIATDEKDKSIFENLKQKYQIYFLEDFDLKLKNYEALIIDQIICSDAEIFLGSRHSTYTYCINTLRGYSGKKVSLGEYTNFQEKLKNYNRFQWETETYGWSRQFDTQWKYERSSFNLGFYGGVNSTIAISFQSKILEIIELQKWLNRKNAAFYSEFAIANPTEVAKEIFDYLKNKYKVYVFDYVIWSESEGAHLEFPSYKYKNIKKHEADIYNSIFQSNYSKSLNIILCEEKEKKYFRFFLAEKGKSLTFIGEKEIEEIIWNEKIRLEEFFENLASPYLEKYLEDRELQLSENFIEKFKHKAFIANNFQGRGTALGCLLSVIAQSHDYKIDTNYIEKITTSKHYLS